MFRCLKSFSTLSVAACVLGGTGVFLALVEYTKQPELIDFSKRPGLPKPAEARQITGPPFAEAVRALCEQEGARFEDQIEYDQ